MTPEQPDERERAERIVNRILSIYPLGIVSNGEPKERLICAIADRLEQTAREERARVWEEAADRVGPHDDLYFEWRLKATALREEGGQR